MIMKTVSRNLPSKQTTLHSGPKKEEQDREAETERGERGSVSAAFDMRLNRNGK